MGPPPRRKAPRHLRSSKGEDGAETAIETPPPLPPTALRRRCRRRLETMPTERGDDCCVGQRLQFSQKNGNAFAGSPTIEDFFLTRGRRAHPPGQDRCALGSGRTRRQPAAPQGSRLHPSRRGTRSRLGTRGDPARPRPSSHDDRRTRFEFRGRRFSPPRALCRERATSRHARPAPAPLVGASRGSSQSNQPVAPANRSLPAKLPGAVKARDNRARAAASEPIAGRVRTTLPMPGNSSGPGRTIPP